MCHRPLPPWGNLLWKLPVLPHSHWPGSPSVRCTPGMSANQGKLRGWTWPPNPPLFPASKVSTEPHKEGAWVPKYKKLSTPLRTVSVCWPLCEWTYLAQQPKLSKDN